MVKEVADQQVAAGIQSLELGFVAAAEVDYNRKTFRESLVELFGFD